MTKWKRKSPLFYPPFCRIFLGFEYKKTLKGQKPIKVEKVNIVYIFNSFFIKY
ncbi:hypothetical protein CHCC15290_1900 [Bacillus licheniformis]|nr:hypothetical protein B4090_2386 [Bacillus licheniformis]TWN16516.1 hypothetical protein CHCC14564_1081 [Bacillus licheniformis LMG 17339]KYC83872.1 hypothetical protein B4091_2451 [Bacillus licheniformis]OLF95304.1 hypothetical protein B4094_1350 [Bacillus licheniformis]OLG02236.1 hypothetical protein B4124_2980 [Bacillus licheniformis]